jgi:hypothetical protein
MDVVQCSAWKVSTYSHGYNGESCYKNHSVSVCSSQSSPCDFIMSHVYICKNVNFGSDCSLNLCLYTCMGTFIFCVLWDLLFVNM